MKSFFQKIIFIALALVLLLFAFSSCRFIDDSIHEGKGEGFSQIKVSDLDPFEISWREAVQPETDWGVDGASYKPIVHGYEWGASMDGIVVRVGAQTSPTANQFTVRQVRGSALTITDVYSCDGAGNRASGTEYVYLGIEVVPNNFIVVGTTGWVDFASRLNVTYNEVALEYEGVISPDTDSLRKGVYYGENSEIGVSAYENLAEDNGKNALIVWLHGGGEGGYNLNLPALGNEASALWRDEIQSYFQRDGRSGAYVLAPQCPTAWMDSGVNDGMNTAVENGHQSSYYTKDLTSAIMAYVKGNADVDTSRIYVGGCSNGGYMTLELLFNNPDYFAAAFPICPGYKEINVSNAMVESIKDVPTWFVQAFNDIILPPNKYASPLYARLLDKNANNAYFSMFDKVVGKDAVGKSYIGHYAWVYAFNNEVKNVQSRENITYSTEAENYGFVPNSVGGTEKVGEYDGLWDWLAGQRK